MNLSFYQSGGGVGTWIVPIAIVLCGMGSSATWAQRIRLDGQPVAQTTSTQLPTLGAPPANPATFPPVQTGPPTTFSSPTTIVSPPPMQLPPAGTTAVPQVPGGFDPYGGVPVAPPSTLPPVYGTQVPNGVTVYPPTTASPYSTGIPPGQLTPPPPLGASPYSTPPPGWTGQPYGQANPNSASGAWPSSGSWPSQMWSQAQNEWMPKLIEHTRFRNTYLYGNGEGRDLMINDTEIATTLTCGSCCSGQPLRLSPGFIFHFWGGPDSAVTGVDLPPVAYSTYLAMDFNSPYNQNFGYEGNLTVGLYTDFHFLTDDSIRITGVGLGWVRLDPTTTFKLGVEYLDRLDIKLLPAIGLFMMPTNDFKFDLYFPRPKLARRFPSNNSYDVWGYLGGEYGGGSWTIERVGGMGDQVDINDWRIFLGAEWLRQNAMTGFVEVGYVFNRELFYRSIGAPTEIDDTFMVRGGFAF